MTDESKKVLCDTLFQAVVLIDVSRVRYVIKLRAFVLMDVLKVSFTLLQGLGSQKGVKRNRFSSKDFSFMQI